jgi:hypothetical protein
VTLTDLTTILAECAGIREGVQAAWQRIRDRRVEAISEKHPELVHEYGVERLRDAVGIVVAGTMLRADADLCRELGRARGLNAKNAHRATVRLMEVET